MIGSIFTFIVPITISLVFAIFSPRIHLELPEATSQKFREKHAIKKGGLAWKLLIIKPREKDQTYTWYKFLFYMICVLNFFLMLPKYVVFWITRHPVLETYFSTFYGYIYIAFVFIPIMILAMAVPAWVSHIAVYKENKEEALRKYNEERIKKEERQKAKKEQETCVNQEDDSILD